MIFYFICMIFINLFDFITILPLRKVTMVLLQLKWKNYGFTTVKTKKHGYCSKTMVIRK